MSPLQNVCRVALSAFVAGTAFALATARPAQAQSVVFNEILFDVPSDDNGFEYIELLSATPNTALTGLTLVILEGENVPAGTIDQAISLSSFTTGSNGLLLLRDSVNTAASDPNTNVVTADFSPDIENGANTYLIVSGFTGTVGTDYDTNADGVLDSTPWSSVISGIGYIDNSSGSGGTDYVYDLPGVEVIGPRTGSPNGGGVVLPNAFARIGGVGYVFRVIGTPPGPYTVNPAATSGAGAIGYTLTPGGANVSAVTVPETGSVALLGAGVLTGVGVLLRRRRVAA
ncbi:MAG: hypothetical protein H7Y38_18670 [Armatimonadetes bacterium]|nr:hypothetical protein [Armatimonadota bacterium]